MIILSCNAQQNAINSITTISKKAFAKIDNGKFIFLQDTLSLKKRLIDNISSKKDIFFDKVVILKQTTLGNNPKEFYYVLIKDSNNHIKISRWLNRIGDELFFSNKIIDGEQFEQIYHFCIGLEDCDPEVFDIDNRKFWNCSKDPTCKIASIDSQSRDCKFANMVLISELEK